ncbi:class II glutamine amidotransferase [Anderseniella sp. Alg231-50]|uniref:class II glutamine amidotransferase n=1 Tax=Anderseniella sp. Alg231-50 TaxID=1922226 RepID=UPI000D557CCA
MCELFAMSSRKPSALNYSLNEFSRRGGLTHKNKSGWGIAYFYDRDVFLVKEPLPASDSPLASYIAADSRVSNCVIAHVRLATVGEPSLKNTHPFRFALAGQMHVFAHNGTLKGLKDDYAEQVLHYDPIGDTDSELAFCLLLDRMRPLWMEHRDTVPQLRDRLAVFADFAASMRPRGSANFLYGDGDVLFVHAHKRIYEENGGFSEPRAPGLSIKNCVVCEPGPDYSCDGLRVEMTDHHTTLVASVPLDDTGWSPLPEGVTLAIRNGEEVARITS